MYQDLLDMERKLDWTMSRKRAEIQDTLVKPPTVCRYDTCMYLTRLGYTRAPSFP